MLEDILKIWLYIIGIIATTLTAINKFLDLIDRKKKRKAQPRKVRHRRKRR